MTCAAFLWRTSRIRRAGGPCRRRRAAARGPLPCRPAWSTGWRAPAAPGSGAGRRPAESRCVANECRSACGVAVSGKPSVVAQPLHDELHDARAQAAAFGAQEQRRIGRQRIRAQRDVARDGIAGDGQHRHQPLLAALADDTQHVALSCRGVLAPDPQRFRDAQAGAIEQQQHRRIAGGDPIELGRRAAVHHGCSLLDRQRLGNAVRHLGQRHLQNRAVPGDLFRFQPAKEHAQTPTCCAPATGRQTRTGAVPP